MKPNQSVLLGLSLIFFSNTGNGAFLNVCDRTPVVRDFLVSATTKPCEAIAETDLAGIKRVAVANRRVAAFKIGDFSGLPALEILNIKGNPLVYIQEGLLADLPSLKTLVLFRSSLVSLPEDFLEGMVHLENLHIFGNPFTTIPKRVFERLREFKNLKVLDFNKALVQEEKDRLTALFPAAGTVQLNFY